MNKEIVNMFFVDSLIRYLIHFHIKNCDLFI